ncbi:MAG: hypothetical protein H6Q65_2320 [Firmicutes bacterium]|nr:hypothetical protein [Bacillota bacterium]
METIDAVAQRKGYTVGELTIGQCIDLAKELDVKVSEVVIAEAMQVNRISREEVLSSVLAAFNHNLHAVEVGCTSGSSFIMGKVGQELNQPEIVLNQDPFINKVLHYTLAAQVGNHSVGLQPCAGTGDSCPYTGIVKALLETLENKEQVAALAALILKVGTIFRVGKVTTGCNLEGFGAGSAALAAAFTEKMGGTPEQMEKAMVLALSPTIAVPCTPRVMVAGLCAAHIGGAVVNAHLTANLAVNTTLPVTVPIDVMIAMATAVHPISAKYVVPVVIQYMEPFFKTNDAVDHYVTDEVKAKEHARIEETIAHASAEAKSLSARANSIVRPFGDAVVGGSSQAVGSPTNTARIAHSLAKGEITGVKIELYPELFARRGINVPGILMGAVYGAATDDAKMYREVMGKVLEAKLQVEIIEVDEPQLQRVTVYATEQNAVVEALNRGGGRLVIRNASPSLEEAKQNARALHIDVID